MSNIKRILNKSIGSLIDFYFKELFLNVPMVNETNLVGLE